MSTTVDERVVEMKFDNSLFESGVQTTLGTLDKLKAALKLDGAGKGLEGINTSIQNMNFGPAQEAVDGLQNKFSIMEEFARGVIRNIADDVTNKLKKAINEVTLEPITAGFEEYNTQMNAVQTILANTKSKGSTIDDVNKSLNELNTYADQTIYNFTEMTNNIGRFTAAGVDLETSTKSIKGISNLAAVAGSTTQQASTAMYQLSQAISSGSLKLQDWNSVVNAGMGGEAFQNALKQTSRAMVELQGRITNLAGQGKSAEAISKELGVSLEKVQKLSEEPYDFDVDAAIEKAGSFRESLKDGWITADVLTETLGNLTISYKEVGDKEYEAAKQTLLANGYLEDEVDAILDLAKTAGDAATEVKTIPQLFDTLKESVQSGWTQTWNYIIGDFEEAKELLTGASTMITEIFDGMSTSRNDFWKAFHDEGGRASTIEALTNAFEVLKGVIGPVSEALSTLFPKITADQLNLFCAGLAVATENLKNLVTAHRDDIKNFTLAFITPLQMILNLGGKVLKFVGKTLFAALRGTISIIMDVGTVIPTIVSAFTAGFNTMADGLVRFQKQQRVFAALHDVINAIGTAISTVVDAIANSTTLKNFLSFLTELATQLGIIAGFGFNQIFSIIINGLFDVSEGISNFTKSFMEFSKSVVDKIKGSETFKKFSDQIAPLNKNLGTMSGTVKTFALDVKKNFTGKFNTAVEAVKSFFGTFIQVPSADSVAGFFERILGVITWLIDKVKGGAGSIKDFFASFTATPKDGEKTVGVLEQIKTKIGAVKDAILGLFSKKDGGGDGQTVADRIKGLFGKLDLSNFKFGEDFAKIGEFIKKTFGEWHLETIFDAAKAGSLAYFLIKIGGFFKSIKDVNEQAKSFIGGCQDMVDSMSGVFDATAKQLNADAMKHIAEAVAIIVGSIVVLGFMDEDALARAALVVGVVLYLLTRLADGTKKVDVKDVAEDKFETLQEGVAGFLDGMKDAFAKAIKLVGMAAIIVALGVTVGILVICIHSLAKLNKDGGVGAAWMGVIQVVALLGVLTAAIIAISKFAGDKKGLKAALVIGSMASAVKKLTKSVQIMSKIPEKALKRGMRAVIKLSIVIGALSLVSKQNNLPSLGAGMSLVAAALTLLMVPLMIMGNMDVTKLSQGGFAIIVLLSVMTALGALASSSMAGAASILVMSLAIDLLVPALIALGLAAPVALVGILALAAGFVVFAAGGALLTLVAPALLTTATALAITTVALLAAGAGFTLIIGGMAAFAGSLAILGAALPGFANGIVQFATTISANAETIRSGFLTLILSISSALLAGVPAIMITVRMVVASVVIGLCMAIRDCVGPIAGTIVECSVAIMEGVAERADRMWAALFKIITTFFQQALLAIDSMLGWLRENALVEIERFGLVVLKFIIQVVTAMVYKTADFIKGLGIPFISDLAGGISGGIDDMVDGIQKKIDDIDLAKAAKDKLEETAKGVEEGKESVKTATDGLSETVQTGLGNAVTEEDGAERGAGFISGLTSGISEHLGDVKSVIGGIFGGGGEGAEGGAGDIAGAAKQAGAEGGEGLATSFVTSLTDHLPDVGGAITTFMGGGEEGAGPFGDTNAMGSDSAESLIGGFSSKLEELAPDLNSKLTQSFDLDPEAMKTKGAEQGKNIDDGMAQGINDNAAVTTDAATAMATATADASAAELGIQSPSTKFAEQGKYIDEGLANGITDNQNVITTAVSNMVSAVVRAVSSKSNSFRTEGGKVPTNYASGITGGLERVKAAATKLATTAATAAGGKTEEYKTAGGKAATSFASGLGSQSEAITNAGATAGDNFKTGISSKAGEVNAAGSSLAANGVSGAASRNGNGTNPPTFYSVGRDASEGFRLGILSKAAEVAQAAAKVASDALTANKNTIKSSSPSKKFMQLGEYSSEGYAIGITNKEKMVTKSSREVAQAAMDTVSSTVKKFSKLSSADAGLKPVITPVIDTRAAMSSVNSLGRAVSLTEGMATTARISEDIEANYTINHDQAEMQAMMKGMYAYMEEYFPQFAGNRYAVLSDSTVNGLTRKINRRLGAQLL